MKIKIESCVSISCDSISTLREQDVFRVLDWADSDQRINLGEWIVKQRPDLTTEVSNCLSEITEEERKQ